MLRSICAPCAARRSHHAGHRASVDPDPRPGRGLPHRRDGGLRTGAAQVPDLTVTVLDDASGDDTTAAARRAGADDPRLRVRREDGDPPLGWLGKPFACQRLADAADGSVLVFLDADVVLDPDAVSAGVAALRSDGADFGSLWPRQLADGLLPRLVQPLQQWSWATTLPLHNAARSSRPSLAAANGQFLIVTRDAYRAIGGHAAVADCVLEDIELARAMKRAGRRTALWDGSALASCRMYDTSAALREGYRKSLWAAFGPRGAPLLVRTAAALGAWCVLGLAYLVPPAAVVVGPGRGIRLIGLVGCAAATGNRAAVAGRTGSSVWPDSAGHAASIALLIALSADSLVAHAMGRTRWKGRPVTSNTLKISRLDKKKKNCRKKKRIVNKLEEILWN